MIMMSIWFFIMSIPPSLIWLTIIYTILDRNGKGLFHLFYLQVNSGVRKELWKMTLHQIIDASSNFRDIHDFFIGEFPHKFCRIATPKFTGGDPSTRGKYRSCLQDGVGLHQWTFHENWSLSNNAFRFNGTRPQETGGTNCYIPFYRCFCWKTWKYAAKWMPIYVVLQNYKEKSELQPIWLNFSILNWQGTKYD